MFKPTFLVPHPWVPWTDPVPSRLVAVEWTGGRRVQRFLVAGRSPTLLNPDAPRMVSKYMAGWWFGNVWNIFQYIGMSSSQLTNIF